jgi:uncharacterized protein (DUF305 family)
MNKRIFLIAATAMIVAVGCGGNNGSGQSAGGSSPSAPASAAAQHHNDHDVMFAQMMIPHHQQAIEMAELAGTRAKNPQVKALARQIEQAQDPEIKTMTGWLAQWGVQVPEPGGMEGMEGMDHGGGSGMMSDQDVTKLQKASGAEFDSMFLTMMIEHHEGAVTMAKQQQAQGTYAPAKTMAATIIATQTAEINQMRQLAGK